MVLILGLLQRTYSKLTPGVTAEVSVFSVFSLSGLYDTHQSRPSINSAFTPTQQCYSSHGGGGGTVLDVLMVTFVFFFFKMQKYFTNTWNYFPKMFLTESDFDDEKQCYL